MRILKLRREKVMKAESISLFIHCLFNDAFSVTQDNIASFKNIK
jgi:hypothetical protein